MKKVFIVGFIFLVLLFVLLRIGLSGNSAENQEPAIFTDLNSSVTPTESLPKRPATTSSPKQVTDITKLPEAVDLGDGMYSLEGTRSDKGAAFSMLYSKTDNSYSIAILAEPIKGNRDAASRYFLEILQTDEATACSLNVYIGTVAGINPRLAGQNLGLSFCPNAVKI